MKEETSNTEQSILKAAEKEFLKKGFSGSKTTEIAKEAGVTHAMLHYYFRTKENLFNKVFEEKAKQLADTFLSQTLAAVLASATGPAFPVRSRMRAPKPS